MLGDLEGGPPCTTRSRRPGGSRRRLPIHDEVSKQDGSEEAAQHLKLAQTYLEMGMSEEAIGSLQTAARSPRHRFEAASIARPAVSRLSRICARAIEWFERAAEAPAPSAEDGRALLYDLGVSARADR